MDSSKLKVIIIVVLALIFALYLGIAAATAQTEAFAWIGGGLFLTLCLVLGRHIWLLIPATLGMKGVLNFIPGTPAPWHLMSAVVAGFYLLRLCTRQQRFHIRWTGMETSILLVALTILQAFLRNPAGVRLFGGDVAGGKPYFIFAVAFTAYLLISMADADFRMWRWAIIAYISGSILDGIIVATSGLVPAFAERMIFYYSNVSYEAATDLAYNTNMDVTRISQFGQLGGILGGIACFYWRPLAILDLTKPWRFLTALGGVLFTILAGYRSNFVGLAVNFSLASILRKKPIDLIVVGFCGILCMAFVVIAIPNESLPYSVQRVMSIIPGYAGADVQKDAKASEDFRFEMWELALTTDKYIHNKILGDGFQYSRDEYNAREAMRLKDFRLTGGMNTVDMFMITGSYHGFHVETIRFTGVIGLIAATAALIVFSVFSYRNIRDYRGHPGWNHVLFICAPYLLAPLWYWFVFGEYKGDFAVMIASVGLVKLLHSIHLKENAAARVTAGPA